MGRTILLTSGTARQGPKLHGEPKLHRAIALSDSKGSTMTAVIAATTVTIPQIMAAGVPNGATRRRVRLVLVDDDDDFRETLSRDLTDEGCVVTAFASGSQ